MVHGCGGIVATPQVLLEAWDILQKKGPELGFILNPMKCEWTWLDSSRADPCPLSAVQLVELDKVDLLGVPFGTKWSSEYVRSKLLKSKEVMDKLAELEDTQVAFYMLKNSYNIVKATHFMRTTD